jgi:hypothetical protein
MRGKIVLQQQHIFHLARQRQRVPTRHRVVVAETGQYLTSSNHF